MDDLFDKYKERINSLPISPAVKEEIYTNFHMEIQTKLLGSFVDTLTMEQQKSIAEASTDEEAARVFFSLLSESLEIPEFLQFVEQVYTDAMMKALSELPSPESLRPTP